MTKSWRQLIILSVITLGLAGAIFASQVAVAHADIAISEEIGGNTPDGGNTNPPATPGTGSEGSFTTPGTGSQGDEGSFTTPDDGDNGGGGGGGGGGRRRARPAPPQVLGANTCTYPYLTKYIKWGAANDPVEVTKLQRFLRDHEGFSSLAVTGIYDEPTLTAVMAFQRRYADDVLDPWGLTPMQPTGYVFITTTLVVNRLYCDLSTDHNLDLRHVYDRVGTGKEGGKEGSAALYRDTQSRLMASSTFVASLTPEETGATSTAAASGVLSLMRDNLEWWLLPLIILIILVFIYLLWRERRLDPALGEYDDDSYQAPSAAPDEVRIDEEEGGPASP